MRLFATVRPRWLLVAAGVILAAALAVCPAHGQRRIIVNNANNGVVQGPVAAAQADPNEDDDQPAAKRDAMPLVNTDEELDEFLRLAAKHAEAKEYGPAIEILQALIASDKPVFHRAEGAAPRYISLRAAAMDLLGKMPEEGRELYRRVHDAPAGRLFDEARRTGDAALLRRVAEEYRYTRHGGPALDLWGAMQFDQGGFLAAARAWESAAAAARGPNLDPPMLLAKAAVAYHLAGEPKQAAAILTKLKAAHADATGAVAGRRENLVAFVERSLATPAPAAPATETAAADVWPSVAGSPTGLARMAACDATMFPLWRQPDNPDRRKAMIQNAAGMSRQTTPEEGAAYANRFPAKAELRDGRAFLFTMWPGQPRVAFALPAMVHPVVVRDTVIVREFDEIAAYDVTTGRRLWQTAGLPMTRELQTQFQGFPFHPYMSLMGDTGRYTLTVGGDAVYGVSGFLPSAARQMFLNMGRQGEKAQTDSSTLAAVSVSGQGKILWRIGSGQGTSDAAKEGKFLCAPTYAGGRLYAMVSHLHAYYVVCLDAATGATVWETCVGQEPSSAGEGSFWRNPMFSDLVTCRGSPPAVADGRVYATTNAGLLASLSADTGQPIWIYQYDSLLNESEEGRSAIQQMVETAQGGMRTDGGLYPPNPLIVTRGRLIALPCDSPSVLALDTETGEPAWKASRRKQHDLTAIDEGRLLLSGKDLVVLKASDGSPLASPTGLGEITGRPAVTPAAVIASGKGRLVRMDLKDYSLSRQTVAQDDCLLGRLISIGGRLVAASPAGVCAYFKFDDAWQHLGRLVEKADADKVTGDRVDLRLKRGQFALVAGRVDQAEVEFRAANAIATEAKDTVRLAQVRPWLYRLALRQAGAAKDEADTERLLREAEPYSPDSVAEAEMQIRWMRFHERFGRPGRAVEIAQAVSEKYAETRLRDVDLGSTDDLFDRLSDTTPRDLGYRLGQKHVARLIEEHGQTIYAAFDAAALDALNRGRGTDVERMLAAQARYPHSESADDLLMASAERLYAQARRGEALNLDLLDRADRVLAEMRRYPPAGPLAPAAAVGTALANLARFGRIPALLQADLKRIAAETPVDFADFHGTVGQALALLDAAPAAAATTPLKFPSYLAGPLQEVYRMRDTRLVVLRDSRRRPIRIGPKILVCTKDGVVCLDTRADDFASGVVWSATLGEGDDGVRTAHLTPDLKYLAVIDSQHLAVIEMSSGAVVHQAAFQTYGIQYCTSAVGSGYNVLLADHQRRIKCLRLPRGEVVWQTRGEKDPNQIFLEIEGDVVLAQDHAFRGAHLYDSRTGRPLLDLAPTNMRRTEAVLTPEGFLVTAVEGQVAFYDPQRAAKTPLWQVPPPANRQTLLLGVSDRYAAVSDGASRTVTVLDVTESGRVVTQVRPMKVAEKTFVPCRATFDGARMYLVCGPNVGGIGRGRNQPFANAMTPALRAVDLVSGQTIWMTSVAAGDNMYTNMEDPALAGRHIALLVKPNDFRETGKWFVLNRESGQVIASGRPTLEEVSEGDINYFQMRRQMIGTPVVLNGRLLVEDDIGLTLFRSPL